MLVTCNCSQHLSIFFVAGKIGSKGVPDGIAVLAGLAMQETQLLERLAENVFAAHFVLKNVEDVCLDGERELERS